MRKHDVIVVGARCAGAPLAMLLARKGLSVLLLDRARFPSDTLSSHQLQVPGVALLREWGLLGQVAATTPGVSQVAFDTGTAVLCGAYPRHGGVDVLLSPRRTLLDQVLLDAAGAAGADVREGVIVEDLSKDIDRAVKEKTLPELPNHFGRRFTQEDGSVDGVLCWDVFDYLDKNAAAALARQIVRVLRPDGVALAFFNTLEPKEPNPAVYTKHVVVDQQHLQYRPYPAARGKQKPFQIRDIQRMFEPLRIAEQFLLKTNLREVLFRKRPEAAAPPAASAAGV